MSIWAGLSLQRRPTRVPLETLPMEGKLARTSREKVLEKCCTLSWSLDSLKTASLSKNPKGHPPHHPVWPLIPEDCFLLSARDCLPEQPQGGHALPLGPGLLLSSLSFHPPLWSGARCMCPFNSHELSLGWVGCPGYKAA